MAYQKFRDRQKSPAKRFLLILGLVMFALYFSLGVLIIVWDKFPLTQQIEKPWRIAFALLLVVYSFFRFTRLLKSQQEEDDNDDETQ